MNKDLIYWFLSLACTFGLGALGGILFNKIKMPRLIWYIVLGILLGPSLLNWIQTTDLWVQEVSSVLRQIALTVILTRSALSIDIKALKAVGRPAILMCFIPATFEIIGVVVFAPLLLHISYIEALVLGSVLAAVSPAVVGSRMIWLKQNGFGNKHHVPELILAGSSCDDIYVIVLFYGFKAMLPTMNGIGGSFNALTLLKIPSSILTGVAIGIGLGALLVYMFKKIKMNKPTRVFVYLGLSLALVALENYINLICAPYAALSWFTMSGLLGVIVAGLIISKYSRPTVTKSLIDGYGTIWNGFELILFTLVGAMINFHQIGAATAGLSLAVICLALIFRSLGVFLCILNTQYTWKERLFIIISYLPKATVQASIGGICFQENLQGGLIILTAAVVAILFTATIGAITMDKTYKHLLPYQDPKIVNKLKKQVRN